MKSARSHEGTERGVRLLRPTDLGDAPSRGSGETGPWSGPAISRRCSRATCTSSRLKDLLIVDGRNVHPADVEALESCHPTVDGGRVAVVPLVIRSTIGPRPSPPLELSARRTGGDGTMAGPGGGRGTSGRGDRGHFDVHIRRLGSRLPEPDPGPTARSVDPRRGPARDDFESLGGGDARC